MVDSQKTETKEIGYAEACLLERRMKKDEFRGHSKKIAGRGRNRMEFKSTVFNGNKKEFYL